MVSAEDNPRYLIVSAAQRLCALRLGEVTETLRPPAIAAVGGAPRFVRGLAVIRGHSVPVVDLGELLGGKLTEDPQRAVTLRVGARVIALLVDSVLGVRAIDTAQFSSAVPLLGEATTEIASALGSLDAQLLIVLRAGHVVPQETLAAMDSLQDKRGAHS